MSLNLPSINRIAQIPGGDVMTAHESHGQGAVSPAAPIDWALAYSRYNLDVFPVRADKTPLTANGCKDATTDPEIIKAWWRRWPCADPAWALRGTVVVVDIDIKNGKNGYRDFERLNGCGPHDVETPTTSTPSGGLQLFYSATKPHRNRVAIDGSGIDLRTVGGYVVLPCADNGRHWLKRLRSTPLQPAPPWLDCALEGASASGLDRHAAQSLLSPRGRRQARAALELACLKIAAAPGGSQDDTRHRQCFRIGALIARGELDYATAVAALIAAARRMPAHRRPWRDIDERVEASIIRGMERAT
jgi:hypothetical protein